MKKFVLSTLSVLAVVMVALPAFAAEGAAAGSAKGIIAFSSALCMAIGTLAGAFSQGRTASAALEGIARNPQSASVVQTPMIIALALTESLVLFALVIAFFLQLKI